jgi:hypothetical protein
MRAVITVLAAAALAACSSPPPVPVEGTRAGLSALAGRWEGEYSSEETGRGGSIVFTLEAGSDTAAGDVLMIPAGTTQPLRGIGPGGPPFTASGPTPEPLTIRFVRVEGGTVSGRLNPYRAPDCDCVVSTMFSGALRGDSITGTFVTRGGSRSTAGRWKVLKKH